MAHNLLTEPLIRFETPGGLERGSLPDVYAALIADRVESFPALRAHQEPAWHMFLAQLGAIACHRAGLSEPPADADTWQDIIGRLTRDAFPDDEPWCLVVADWSKPAFLQPPVPDEVKLKDEPVSTPDALDMLITSRNHDLKQAVAATPDADDWIFALVSLQTMEGFGGRGNYGIARMNGGSSSRVQMSLAPMAAISGEPAVRHGRWLRRDLIQLLRRRGELLKQTALPYPVADGIALSWTVPWPEGEQLALEVLDIWFVEVCRRVRLQGSAPVLSAKTGNSSAERVKAKHLSGNLGDPWAPIHKGDAKSLTIGDSGSFHYTRVVDLALSSDYQMPTLAELQDDERSEAASWLLILAAIARGNSKTGGFKSRAIPLDGRSARRLGGQRQELHQLAKQQIEEIDKVDKALRNALAIANAAGDRVKMDQDSYARTKPYRDRLDAVADREFFDALWKRFEAEQDGNSADAEAVRRAFLLPLIEAARDLLEDGLDDIPCPSIRRPRAEARARRWFSSQLRSSKTGFPGLFDDTKPDDQEMTDAA